VKILFDHGTPRSIARSLVGHQVTGAAQLGWHELGNGVLIQRAEEAGYDLLLSTGQNIRYQQKLSHWKITIVVLADQQWPNVRLHLERIVAAVSTAVPGSYVEVDIAFPPKPPRQT